LPVDTFQSSCKTRQLDEIGHNPQMAVEPTRRIAAYSADIESN